MITYTPPKHEQHISPFHEGSYGHSCDFWEISKEEYDRLAAMTQKELDWECIETWYAGWGIKAKFDEYGDPLFWCPEGECWGGKIAERDGKYYVGCWNSFTDESYTDYRDDYEPSYNDDYDDEDYEDEEE